MATKMRLIKLVIDLEVVYDESLDDDFVMRQYCHSDRCSTLSFHGEPGVIIFSAATAEVTKKWSFGMDKNASQPKKKRR